MRPGDGRRGGVGDGYRRRREPRRPHGRDAARAPEHVRAGDGPCRRRRRASPSSVTVLGPDGVAAATDSPCWDTRYTNDSKRFVDYRGNGTYTLTTSLYTDVDCTAGKRDVSYPWTVNASVAISPPAPVMMTRAVNSFSTITQQFNFAGNPGASGYEIKFAKGAVAAARRQPLLAGAQGRLPQPHDRQGRADRRARAGRVHDRRPRQVRQLLLAVEPAGELQPDRAVRPLLALVPRFARAELPGPRRSSASPARAAA